MRMKSAVRFILLTTSIFSLCYGHGRLLDPPGRSSIWRDPRAQNDPLFKKAKKNYNDNELNCGGYQNQWEEHGGKCSVCGDPWQGPHQNIPPNGKYARGIITRDYDEGSVIKVKVEVTADHRGFFDFRLCVNNNVTRPVTRECLDRTVLRILNASQAEQTRYYTHEKDNIIYELHLQLPLGIYGEQVVMQWRYHTGNSWGCDNMRCCVGCGEVQEEFYACADILIRRTNFLPSTATTTTAPERTTAKGRECTANAQWKMVPGMDKWCETNCVRDSTCPESHCVCLGSDSDDQTKDSPGTGQSCVGTGLWSGNGAIDNWCSVNCPLGSCPADMCTCS